MFMRRSLGVLASAARGITVSSISNASPHVATLGALHNIPSLAQNPRDALRRFALFGSTGSAAANGIFSLVSTGTNTFSLPNTTTGGAVTVTNTVIAAVFDQTPFMKGHAAVAYAHRTADQLVLDGTFAVMGSKSDATDAEILASDSTTLATYFEDCINDVAWSVPGATNDGIDEMRNVDLRRMMYAVCSAHAAGGMELDLLY